ncbi:hypothetical protein H5410_039044 [Solanum commersonii]|uniref:Uncharacterized protein n=1 Tax=Solanum commersonii TaxID=4109 RepID=A0A9J5YEY3_SOLCO|nr:hypothetical protein H5410_039044 [Solanum commersonii]
MDKTEDLALEDRIRYRKNKFSSAQVGKIKTDNTKDKKNELKTTRRLDSFIQHNGKRMKNKTSNTNCENQETKNDSNQKSAFNTNQTELNIFETERTLSKLERELDLKSKWDQDSAMLKSRKVLSKHIFESFPRAKTKHKALFLLKTKKKNKINPNRRIELESEEELKRGEVVYLYGAAFWNKTKS